MEFSVETVVKKEDELELVIKGEGHTLMSLLRKELFQDPSVIHTGYMIKHPLIKEVKLYVKTNGEKTPQKALEDALKRLDSNLDELRAKFDDVLAET